MTLEGELRDLPRDIRRQLESVDVWRAWDVTSSEHGARAFAVGAERVFVLGATRGTSLVAPWSEVEELSFASPLQMRVAVAGQEPQLVTLKRLRHRDEILAAMPPSHRERLGLDELPRLADSSPRPLGPAGRSATSAALLAPDDRPEDTLWRLLGVGLALQVIGGIILAASWPEVDGDGSSGGMVVGWLLGSAGALPLLTALIGFGTSLGIRASRAR